WASVLLNPPTSTGTVVVVLFPTLAILICGLLLPGWPTVVVSVLDIATLLTVLVLTPLNPALANASVSLTIFYAFVAGITSLAGVLRWRDQAELDVAVAALRESGEHYRQMFEEAERLREFNTTIVQSIVEGLTVSDAEGKVTVVNRTILAMLGYEAEELIGQPILSVVAPRELERIREFVAQWPAGVTSSYETWLRAKRGAEVPVLVSTTPLMKDGQFLGTLSTLTDISAARAAEAQLKQANDKLTTWLADAEQRTRDMTLLAELGDLLQTSLTADEAYRVVTSLMLALFPETAGRLYIMRESRNLVESVSPWGPVTGGRESFEPSQCWALRRGHIHVVHELSAGAGSRPIAEIICDHVQPPWPAAYMCVPMIAQTELLGILYLEQPVPGGQWTDAQVRLARTVADSLGLALANLRLRETLRRQSIRDPLTGLFNRRYLEETLEREVHRARREQKPLGVMMLDLDHFKDFNDALGHEAGDRLLKALGSLIQSLSRAEDIACRYGGEEFIIMLPGASLAVTSKRADAIRQAVRALGTDFRVGLAAGVTISIGVAAFPEHGATGVEVMRAADATLYQAKHAGRDRVMAAGVDH
ncbi:MAG: diguanylate cyclase, partial [Nevskiales bacterium]